MELKNRIEKIMENSGLTPSEFADKIDVQRSAISHITSGRNKPSLEFLMKIKSAYPEIDTDWLIFGLEKENISEEIIPVISSEEKSVDFHPTLFDELEIEQKVENSTNQKEIIPNEINLKTPSDRQLKKVLLFYQDGTFEEYSPFQNPN